MSSKRLFWGTLAVLVWPFGCGASDTSGSSGQGASDAGNGGSGAASSGGGGTGGTTAGGGTTASGGATGGGGSADPCASIVCTPPATCEIQNAQGVCVCPPGYTPDGPGCVDVDECAGANPCGADSQCQNYPGSYSCGCPPGSYSNGADCTFAGHHALDVGSRQVCFLDPAGAISCRGFLRPGRGATPPLRATEPMVVNADADWVSMEVSGYDDRLRFCGLKPDGSFWCWGDSLDGVAPWTDTPVEVSPGTVWATVDNGAYHSCGIEADGTLWCWGANNSKILGVPGASSFEPVQVGQDGDWAFVAAGDFHNCAIKKNGDLHCWGANFHGELGIGTQTVDELPVFVGSGWEVVSAALHVTCGVRLEGTLWCWGDNSWGELGVGFPDVFIPTPTQLGSATDWRDVDVGGGYSCATKQDGSLWCWGALGSPKFPYSGVKPLVLSDAPVKVDLPSEVVDFSVSSLAALGGDTACAQRLDGELTCWGGNRDGQVGSGVFGDKDVLAQVGAGVWSGVSAGDLRTCGVAQDGSLWSWGILPTSDYPTQVPQEVGALTGWTSAGAGFTHLCALRDDGTLWCWGQGPGGALGLGGITSTLYPTQVGAATDWDVLGVGFEHVCAIRKSGDLYCWGDNDSGEIGNGNTTDQYVPVYIAPGAHWKAVSAGTGTCAIRSTGELYCWGEKGGPLTPTQVGVAADWTAVAVGRKSFPFAPDSIHRTCGIRAPGTLHCWGDAPLGDGTSNPSAAPLQIGNDADWATVAMNTDTVCATKQDHRLFCWGADLAAKVGSWTRTDLAPVQIGNDADFEAVSVGTSHLCATKTGGALVCWGDNRAGQLGTGDIFYDTLVTTGP